MLFSLPSRVKVSELVAIHDRNYEFINTVPLADFENQGAYHLAGKHDPEGSRTIGEFFPTTEENVIF